MPVVNVNDGVNIAVSIAESPSFNVTVNKGPLNGTGPVGGNGTLQYNANGVFGGVPFTSYTGGKLTLGDISNLAIGGGNVGEAITKDSGGNLVWSDVANAAYANIANFAYYANSSNFANLANIAIKLQNVEKVSFSFGDATPKNIVEVPAGATVTEVVIVLLTQFNDPSSTLSVGDSGQVDRLLATTDITTSVTGTYTTEPAYKYLANTMVTLSISPGTSSSGNGFVILTYQL